MNARLSWMVVFVVSCGSTVTQDPAQDPISIQDAGTDAEIDANAPDANSSIIGKACTTDEECGGVELRCHMSGAGGYCSRICSDSTECPAGSVCAPLPLSRVTGLCMLSCTNTTDCREGLTCAKTYWLPGDPSSPSSSTPVCWEAPPPNP